MSQVRTPVKSGGGRKRPSPELLQQQSSPSTPRTQDLHTSPRSGWSKRRRRLTPPLARSSSQAVSLLFPTRRKASDDELPATTTPSRLADLLDRTEQEEEEDDECCCTPRNNSLTTAATPDIDDDIPKAPARRLKRNWLNLMLNNDVEALELALSAEDEDTVSTEVRAEWLLWDPKTHEVTGSQRVWIQPILLAARWCSPKIVLTLIQHGAPLNAKTDDGQNLLSVLCSQPPVSMEFFHAVRGFHAPPDFSLDMMALAHSSLCGGKRSPPKICDQFIVFRRKETDMVARLLILHGVSPRERDDVGRTAEDYASLFGHSLIIDTFQRARRHPNTLGARKQTTRPSLPSDDQISIGHCRTPVRPASPADFTSPGVAFSAASASLPTGYGLTGCCTRSSKLLAKKRTRRSTRSQKQIEEPVPPALYTSGPLVL